LWLSILGFFTWPAYSKVKALPPVRNRVQAEDDRAIAFAELKLLKRLPHDRKATLTCKVSQ